MYKGTLLDLPSRKVDETICLRVAERKLASHCIRQMLRPGGFYWFNVDLFNSFPVNIQ